MIVVNPSSRYLSADNLPKGEPDDPHDDELDTTSSASDATELASEAGFAEAKREAHVRLEKAVVTWKERLCDVFEGNPSSQDFVLAIIVNAIILVTILFSCVLFCIESYPRFYARRSLNTTLFWLETVCVLVFIIEAVLRVAVVPFRSLSNAFFIIDVMAICSYFLDLILDVAFGTRGLAGFFGLLRLIRVFRVFKLSRYSTSLQLVFVVLKSSARGLTILLVPLILVILMFSTAIYFVELQGKTFDRERKKWFDDETGNLGTFQSLPDAIWFCMVTITTVGYGDLVPHSVLGKIIAVWLQIIGVLTLSFPNIVLGSNLNFAFKAHHRRVARRKIGRLFRLVVNALRFIKSTKQLLYERRMLRREEEGPSTPILSYLNAGAVSKMPRLSFNAGVQNMEKLQLSTNYLVPKTEFDQFRKDEVEQLTRMNVRFWEYKGLSAVKVLQRLLEGFSGVATTKELFQSFTHFPLPNDLKPHLKDIALVCLYLFDAGMLQIFAFRKGSAVMLVALTQQAITELLLHPEECAAECWRSADMARFVWRRTSGTTVLYSLQTLRSQYLRWNQTESLVDNDKHTPVPDLKPKSSSKALKRSFGYSTVPEEIAKAIGFPSEDRHPNEVAKTSPAPRQRSPRPPGQGRKSPSRHPSLVVPSSPTKPHSTFSSHSVSLADAKLQLRALIEQQKTQIFQLESSSTGSLTNVQEEFDISWRL